MSNRQLSINEHKGGSMKYEPNVAMFSRLCNLLTTVRKEDYIQDDFSHCSVALMRFDPELKEIGQYLYDDYGSYGMEYKISIPEVGLKPKHMNKLFGGTTKGEKRRTPKRQIKLIRKTLRKYGIDLPKPSKPLVLKAA